MDIQTTLFLLVFFLAGFGIAFIIDAVRVIRRNKKEIARLRAERLNGYPCSK